MEFGPAKVHHLALIGANDGRMNIVINSIVFSAPFQ